MKQRSFHLTNAARLCAEASGRRGARAAFDRVTAHGYDTKDQVFHEIGITLLMNWAREGGISDEAHQVWLSSAIAQFDALIAGRGHESRTGVITDDPYASLRDAASGVIRKLGLMTIPSRLSPKHWQHVLALVEARMRTRGVELPEGWREELAVQMGRIGVDTAAEPKT